MFWRTEYFTAVSTRASARIMPPCTRTYSSRPTQNTHAAAFPWCFSSHRIFTNTSSTAHMNETLLKGKRETPIQNTWQIKRTQTHTDQTLSCTQNGQRKIKLCFANVNIIISKPWEREKDCWEREREINREGSFRERGWKTLEKEREAGHCCPMHTDTLTAYKPSINYDFFRNRSDLNGSNTWLGLYDLVHITNISKLQFLMQYEKHLTSHIAA